MKNYARYLEKLLQKGYAFMDYENQESDLSDEECIHYFNGINKSFSSLGYCLSLEDITKFKHANIKTITKFYYMTYHTLSRAKGNHVRHSIFYKNFPEMEQITEDEYVVRALLHYLTAEENDEGFMNDDLKDIDRIPVHNDQKEILHIINKDEADKILIMVAKSLFEGNVAIPYREKDFLHNAMKDFKEQVIPAEIPFKENIGMYVSIMTHDGKLKGVLNHSSLRFIKTLTDFLRVYASLSFSSPTLREKVRFISLSRPLRVLFISILDDIALSSHAFDELNKHEFLFKKAFEKLHIGDYANQFPHIFDVVNKFRNGDYKTFNGTLNELIDTPEKYIDLLSSNPGEFARRMDFLLRKEHFNRKLVLQKFDEITPKISSMVLIQLWEFFLNRQKEEERIFCIKKQHANTYYTIQDNRQELNDEVKKQVIDMIEKALLKRFADKEKIENVYLDESMKAYMVPTSMRSKSASPHALTFGSRIKLEQKEGDFMRLFTHWKNNKSRTDIDLSLEFLSEDLQNSCSLAWHDMGSGKMFSSYHSGDIVTAPKGASEFIDFDYMKASEFYRYVLVMNTVFTGQQFSEIADCFTGVMFMPHLGKKGNVFNPEFVKYKFDLAQNSWVSIMFLVDLKTMELIYLDSPLAGSISCQVAAKNLGLRSYVKAALKRKMSLYELICLHKEHLTFVDHKEDASFIISDCDGANLSPSHIEEIASNWL